MNDLLVITAAGLAAWSVLVAVMTVALIGIIWSARRLSRDAGRSYRPAFRRLGIEEMPGHPERIDVLPDPVEERAFGVIGDRLLADEDITRALHKLGWHE